MLPGVLQVNDVNEREPRYTVRRVLLPASGIESFTVIGPDLRPVELIDEYLAWLTDCERSPNTVEAYARSSSTATAASPPCRPPERPPAALHRQRQLPDQHGGDAPRPRRPAQPVTDPRS
jgi:hypothetical protein